MNPVTRLQSTARQLLAESFARAVEMSCAEETDVVVELRGWMWGTVIECLIEGAEID